MIANVHDMRFYLILKVKISDNDICIHAVFGLEIRERIIIHRVSRRADYIC